MNRIQHGLARKAVAKFKKQALETGLFAENTSFALVGEAGVFLNPSTACFASLGDWYKNRGTGVDRGFLPNRPKNFCLLVGINLEYNYRDREEHNITDEDSVRYLDWLLKRSPWSKAFVSKAPKSAYDRRVVIISTEVAGNLMGGAGVAVRRLWEYCKILRAWLDLTARGVPENLAYYLASCLEGSYDSTVHFNGAEIGHHNLRVQGMGKSDVVRFIESKPFNITGKYCETNSYDKYSGMFNHPASSDIFKNWIVDKMPTKPIVGGEVKEVKVTVNPFAKAARANVDRAYMSWDLAMDNMGLWWPEIYKELGLRYE